MTHVFVTPAKGFAWHQVTEFTPVPLKWQATAAVGSIEHMLARERAPAPLPAPPTPLPVPYYSAEAEAYAEQNIPSYRPAPLTRAMVWLTLFACCGVCWCGMFVAVPVVGGWLRALWR